MSIIDETNTRKSSDFSSNFIPACTSDNHLPCEFSTLTPCSTEENSTFSDVFAMKSGQKFTTGWNFTPPFWDDFEDHEEPGLLPS